MPATCEYAFVTVRRCSIRGSGSDRSTLTTWMFHVHHDLLCLERHTDARSSGRGTGIPGVHAPLSQLAFRVDQFRPGASRSTRTETNHDSNLKTERPVPGAEEGTRVLGLRGDIAATVTELTPLLSGRPRMPCTRNSLSTTEMSVEFNVLNGKKCDQSRSLLVMPCNFVLGLDRPARGRGAARPTTSPPVDID